MIGTKERKEQEVDKVKEKPHVCSMCAKPSETVICLACENKVRGEVLEHKHGIDKAGRTDTGRR